MEALNAAEYYCPRCSTVVAPEATACPRCGAALTGAAAEERRDLLDNPWVVLGLLFLATGVLGLPFLWRSKGFSPLAKIVIGVAVTIYTAILVGIAAAAVMWAVRSAQQSLAMAAVAVPALACFTPCSSANSNTP